MNVRCNSNLLTAAVCAWVLLVAVPVSWAGTFRAGASAIDISPRVLPALRNGGFLQAQSDRIDDPLHARSLVLSDGTLTLAIAIVDSCMVPRDLCDQIKQLVEKKTGIPADRVLIAATHTHSAPSLMDLCLGCGKDPHYADYFVPRVAEGIAEAHSRLEPAVAGWATVDAPDHTHSRRWLYRPDAYALDPFGDKTVRAMMHPGYQNQAFTGPAGPVDSRMTLLAIRTPGGRPLCVLSNYSMHYFGAGEGFSADYFGEFARYVEGQWSPGKSEPNAAPLVAIMSQGTSGDLHWMDYSQPQREDYPRRQYAEELAKLALGALAKVEYRDDVPLAIAETKLTLARRQPSKARLAWAKKLNDARGNLPPRNLPEVYAQQAEWMHEHPRAELILQAARIGELGLAAVPNEVFAITGLKLKAASPFQPHMNLELANGGEGYIPPPEQHYLGGYTTWPARSAALEPAAEPKIVEALLGLLEKISGKKRRAMPAEWYTAEQRAAIEKAKADDNNRANRGEE